MQGKRRRFSSILNRFLSSISTSLDRSNFKISHSNWNYSDCSSLGSSRFSYKSKKEIKICIIEIKRSETKNVSNMSVLDWWNTYVSGFSSFSTSMTDHFWAFVACLALADSVLKSFSLVGGFRLADQWTSNDDNDDEFGEVHDDILSCT